MVMKKKDEQMLSDVGMLKKQDVRPPEAA